jgi:hypothetical protein
MFGGNVRIIILGRLEFHHEIIEMGVLIVMVKVELLYQSR